MAYQRKQYRNGKPRGGVKGSCVDSGFGSATNRNRSKKNYKGRDSLKN